MLDIFSNQSQARLCKESAKLLTICSEEVTFAFKGEGLAVVVAILLAAICDNVYDQGRVCWVLEEEGFKREGRRVLGATVNNLEDWAGKRFIDKINILNA